MSSSLPDLWVFANEGRHDWRDFYELRSSSTRYRTVGAITERALLLLERGNGRQALINLACTIVQECWRLRKPCLYPTDDPNLHEMPQHITRFLGEIRRNFPEVYLMQTAGEALAYRKPRWRPFQSFDEFDAKEAAEIRLHWHNIRCMIRTQSAEEYHIFFFQMAVSVAHEVTHLLIYFFTGSARDLTPNSVAPPGFRDRGFGEAGRWWELEALGGIPEFYAKPGDRRNPNQSGVPYIFDDMHGDSRGVKISKSYLEQFQLGNVRLPVDRTNGNQPPITRNVLRQTSTEMSKLRQYLSGTTSAAVSDYPPEGSTRYRALSHSSEHQYYPEESFQVEQCSEGDDYGGGYYCEVCDPYNPY